jgi:hypothetical protein
VVVSARDSEKDEAQRGGDGWEDFNLPSGKMTIGDAHADSGMFRLHQLLQTPPYKHERTE